MTKFEKKRARERGRLVGGRGVVRLFNSPTDSSFLFIGFHSMQRQ